jgi:hypothetical protein
MLLVETKKGKDAVLAIYCGYPFEKLKLCIQENITR